MPNRPVVEISFADLYMLWWDDKRKRLAASFVAKGRTGQTERIGWFEKQSKRYWLDYFGNKKIGDINQAYVSGYWAWRMAYWTMASAAEKKKHPNYALNPSKKRWIWSRVRCVRYLDGATRTNILRISQLLKIHLRGSVLQQRVGRVLMRLNGRVIPPFLAGCGCRTYAAIFSFMAGVMSYPPKIGHLRKLRFVVWIFNTKEIRYVETEATSPRV